MTNQKSKKTPKSSRRKNALTSSKRSNMPKSSQRANSREGRGANPKAALNRYLALAREAAASGDRVEAENYRQHAEHYLRVMNAAT